MNHVYRLVWNRKLRVWQAASELASQSRGGGSQAGRAVAARAFRPVLCMALGIALSSLSTALQAACTQAGMVVTCSGNADPAQPGYANATNNLQVILDSSATLGVLPAGGGAALSLTGSNATLINDGRIDANLLGRPQTLSGGVAAGNATAHTFRLTNRGWIGGTTGADNVLPNLSAMAIAVQNGTGGTSHLSNAGTIRSQTIPGISIQAEDIPVVAVYGGGNVDFVNESTGTITGRVAFEASGTPGTGHSFVNAGTIDGSVWLGQGGNNTFTAVSGSSVSRGQGYATADLTVLGMPSLKFAPPGTVNGGLGAGNTLVLQNVLPTNGTGTGTGGPSTTISGDTYINFQNLRVNSGTWTLTGTALAHGGNVELNGGLVTLANSNVLGPGQVNANGGSLAAGIGMTLGNDFVLGPQGLTMQGANAITLAGGLSGGGHLTLNGTAPVILSGTNNYAGGTTVGQEAELRGNAQSLQGDIAVDGALVFTQATSATYAGNLSGGGSLTKEGAGTLTLTGAHTYAGATAISAGTLALAMSGRLPASQVSLQSGATLDLRTASGQTIAALSGLDGSVMLGTNALSLNGSTNNIFGGVISGSGALIKLGTGTQTLTGSNTFTGEVIINGGTLAVGAGALPTNSAIWIYTGGTFDLSAAGSLSIGTLGGNGGRMELGASTLTVGGGTYAGVAGGTGGINKAGTGTLTLNGVNTYRGPTLVQNGALRIGGDASKSTASLASNVNVAGGASVGGFGSVNGNVSIAANGRLAPGNPGGTFTINGNLVMQQGSVAAFSFGAPGTGSAPGAGHSVTVNGDLTLNRVQLEASDAGGFGVGLYRLFDYTGNLALGNGGILPATGLGIQYLAGAKQINLINSANLELNFWNANRQAGATQLGGGSGVWSRTDANWTDAVGTMTSARQPADAFAIFGGAAGTVTVDTATGPVEAKGIQFASDGYRLNGDSLALTGTTPGAAGELRVGDGSLASRAWTATIDNVLTGAGIDKTGLGTLVLNGANTHTQTTRISRGSLSVSSDANLGAATAGLDFQGGTLRVTGTGFQGTARNINLGAAGGGFDIADAANTYTVAQALSGNGKLAKLGAGTLVLTGNNSYLGGTTVQAGTLQIGDGAVSGSIAGNGSVEAGATLAFKRSDRLVFAGDLSGAGELRHAGTGTLVLTGQNTLTGATTIESGTLQVGDGGTSGAVAGNIVNNGSLVFNRADDIRYAGALSGSGAMAKAGAGSLVLTGDSSAYAGAAQLSAGTLQVDGKLGGQLHAGAGTTLAGSGTLNEVTIGAGATLAPGNAASPHGRLNLLGDLNFKPGAAYRVATTAGGLHSSVHVAGTARLAGSVVQLAENGNYAPSTTYAILTADHGVQGRFDAVSSNFAFLSPSLNYDANKVNLVVSLKQVPDNGGTPPVDGGTPPVDGGTPPVDGGTPPVDGGTPPVDGGTPPVDGGTPPVNGGTPPVDGGTPPVDGGTRPIEFADAAVTGNQRAVARALQSLPGGSALRLHVLNLPNGAPPAAFNALSGESHASAMSGLQSTASAFIQAPLTRLRSNLNAGWMPGAPTAQLGLGDAASLPRPAAQPLWTQVYGTWTTLDGDGNAAKTTQSDTGITIGGDQAVGGGWRLGGALGYNSGRSRTSDRASNTQADSYSLTVYGGKAFEAGAGKINLSLGAAYTWHDLDTQRNTAGAGLDQTLKASYGASTGQFFGELGYAVPLNDRITLEPFVGANYSDLRTRGFSESGGDAALRGESGRNTVTTTTLGLHALSTFESAGARGQVHGTLGWRHAFGERNPASTLSFVQGSDAFTVTGAPIARDAAVIELGVGIEVSKRTTVAVSYGGQYGGGNRQSSGTLDVRYRF
ncbi:autotransporter domain-containing protein [Achromobacter sp. SD115]|uniref:autotransporter domain-containing protein n=1 Tax=Achromobacter sp. SD115 TaxID=2782011 RepID=UPI001A97B290|nr:autotransporter domain-containing protein [Achromobacter sp. SD115]MBO1012096.1 autotransporter domain-containing protein [Achromobacter sp. SD115]